MRKLNRPKQSLKTCKAKSNSPGKCWTKFAEADVNIGDAEFDIENARIQDVLKQQKVMEGNMADLIIGLEDATNVFGC